MMTLLRCRDTIAGLQLPLNQRFGVCIVESPLAGFQKYSNGLRPSPLEHHSNFTHEYFPIVLKNRSSKLSSLKYQFISYVDHSTGSDNKCYFTKITATTPPPMMTLLWCRATTIADLLSHSTKDSVYCQSIS